MTGHEVSKVGPESAGHNVLRSSRVHIDPGENPKLRRNGMVEMLLSDGLRLNLETKSQGDPDGWPVFGWHGTPGSAAGPNPRGIALHRLGVRYITVSRPGYGNSDRHEGRIVADCATYLEAAAKAYRITKCSVVGRSGGGPAALACAALLPELVVNGAVFSSMAPPDAIENWDNGMSSGNREAYGAARDEGKLEKTRAEFARVALASMMRSRAVLDSIEPAASDADKRFLGDIAMQRIIAESHADGQKYGNWQGRYDDIIAAQSIWGFDPREITVPVFIVQGGDDSFTPQTHFKWLCENIPTVEVRHYPKMGHIETLELLPEYLSLVREQAHQV